MDSRDRNILVLGILVLLLLAVGYYFLLFSPLRQQYLSAYEQRTQKEQQRAQLEQSVAELENIRRNAPQIERNILEYSKRLPEQDEIPTLLIQIEQIAEGAGATQLVITPGEAGGAAAGGATAAVAAPADGDFSRIPLTMSFEGTYLEMQDFFFRLKNLSRLVTVNETTWEELQEEGGSTTVAGTEELLTVEIQAETYVQPAAAGSTSPAAPAAPGGPTGGTTAAPGGTTAAGGTT